MVCQNTLNMAVGAGGNVGRIFGISHTSGAPAQLDQVAKLVDSTLKAMEQTGATFKSLAQRRLTPTEVVAFIESVFPNTPGAKVLTTGTTNKRATLAELLLSGVGSDLARSTTGGDINAWSAYNAVTEYVDHVVTGGSGGTGNKSNDAARLAANTSALFGRAASLKEFAFTQLRELVTA